MSSVMWMAWKLRPMVNIVAQSPAPVRTDTTRTGHDGGR